MSPEFQIELAEERGGYYYGDCDDAATLSAALCHALDIECNIIAIRLHGDENFSHVFTRTPDLDIDPIAPLLRLPHINFEEKVELPV